MKWPHSLTVLDGLLCQRRHAVLLDVACCNCSYSTGQVHDLHRTNSCKFVVTSSSANTNDYK